MKLLEEKIKKEGKALPNDILKVDSFLNHQIDVAFLNEIGKEFQRLFANEGVNRVLTVEASGIAMAVTTAQAFGNIPVVFAKKVAAANMSKDVYCAALHSYTRQRDYNITVSKEYLHQDDVVLIIDDFLANGEALNALISLCKQAGAKVVGCGIVIEKTYQPGLERIREMGYRVESLARIKHMEEGVIEFVEE